MDTCTTREEDILALLTLVSTAKNSTISNFFMEAFASSAQELLALLCTSYNGVSFASSAQELLALICTRYNGISFVSKLYSFPLFVFDHFAHHRPLIRNKEFVFVLYCILVFTRTAPYMDVFFAPVVIVIYKNTIVSCFQI